MHCVIITALFQVDWTDIDTKPNLALFLQISAQSPGKIILKHCIFLQTTNMLNVGFRSE